MDSRKLSSSYCSSVTIVVFVALCLVGIWMMTSWTVVPFGNVEMSPEETNSEVKKQVSVENEPQHVEDSSGGTAKNAHYKTPQGDSGPEVNQNPDPSGKITQNRPEEITEKNPMKEDTKKKPNDTSGNGNKSDDKYKSEVNNELDNVYKTETEHTSKSETRNESDDTSKSENENDGSENTENDETKTEGGEVDTEGKESNTEGGETNENGEDDVQDKESQGEKNSESDESFGESIQDENVQGENKTDQTKDQVSNDVFPDPAQSELLNETNTQNGAFSTQVVESKNEKDVQWSSSSEDQAVNKVSAGKMWDTNGIKWKLCNVSAGADYIPCLDNEQAIKKLRSTKHYEHRERHCPEEGPTCLVPLPKGYRQPIKWPISRDKIWYSNVPHTKLAQIKGHQNWVKVSGEYLTFPGGGTQFKHGALHYIDFIQESLPDIAWGKQSRVVLDVGCGVASFGGYLFEKDVITMSVAPKDEHEAQVQFALERGIPAVSAVMGTKRLPFPSKVFDIVHCARCRVPWHIEGGMLLLELNRVLRPGGYFVWSATPVYKKLEEDVGIWNAMSLLTKSMCWDLVAKKKDPVNRIGVAIYKKPSSNDCYEKRMETKPPLCEENDDPDAAWNVSLQACMHKVPVDVGKRGSQWPEQWPKRLEKSPIWLNNSQVGVYGKVAPMDFKIDYEHWKHVVSNSYLNGMGVDWSRVRNVMDMRSIYGGFAAALRDLQVWVMNVVTVDSPDTLPIIYDRGLFGIYHDWCESFSTYPRTYDLLHADHLFSELKNRCKLVPVIAEVDRMLRPEGKLIVRDNVETISEVEKIARSLHWEIRLTYSNDREGLLCVQKSMWRPHETETSMS